MSFSSFAVVMLMRREVYAVPDARASAKKETPISAFWDRPVTQPVVRLSCTRPSLLGQRSPARDDVMLDVVVSHFDIQALVAQIERL